MVAPAASIPSGFWDEADRVGLVTMKILVPQVLARLAAVDGEGSALHLPLTQRPESPEGPGGKRA